MLIEIPSLSFPDTTSSYTLFTDAIDKCIGACLTQVISTSEGKFEKPIYFLSYRLSGAQKRWPIIEKEAYAIYYSLQKLDHYLHNAEFVIKCDHKPLKYILESPIQNKKIALWALSISGYNCRIEYLAGTENTVADLLSRVPDSTYVPEDSPLVDPDISGKTYEIGVLNSNRFNPKVYARCQPEVDDRVVKPTISDSMDMSVEQGNDVVLCQLKQGLINDSLKSSIAKRYLMLDNVLYYVSDPDNDPTLRVYVTTHLQQILLKEYHSSMGHLGIDKTYDAIRARYYWTNMYKEYTLNTGEHKCYTVYTVDMLA